MSIVSHPANAAYRDNFDAVFGKKDDKPRHDSLKDTTHRYCDHQTTTNCANQCGAWMGGSRSGGPDPFGACPKRQQPPVTPCKVCERMPQEGGRPSRAS